MAIGKITELRDADNKAKAIYPITSTKAVYMEDGESKLSDELTKISEDMIETTNNLDMAKIGVSGVKYDSLKSRLDNEYLELYNMYNEDKFVPQTGQGLYLNDTRRGMTRNTVIKGKTVKNLYENTAPEPLTVNLTSFYRTIILCPIERIKFNQQYTLYYTLYINNKSNTGGSTGLTHGSIVAASKRNPNPSLSHSSDGNDLVVDCESHWLLSSHQQTGSLFIVRHTFTPKSVNNTGSLLAKFLAFRPIFFQNYITGSNDFVNFTISGIGLYEGDISLPDTTVIPFKDFSYPGQGNKLSLITSGKNLFSKSLVKEEYLSKINNESTFSTIKNGSVIVNKSVSDGNTYLTLTPIILDPGNYKIYCDCDTTKATFTSDSVGAYFDIFYTSKEGFIPGEDKTVRHWLAGSGIINSALVKRIGIDLIINKRICIIIQLNIRQGTSGIIKYSNIHVVKDGTDTSLNEISDYNNELELPINGLKALPSGLCDQIYYDGKNLILEQNVKEITNEDLIKMMGTRWVIEDKEANWKFGGRLYDCKDYNNQPNNYLVFDNTLLPNLGGNVETVNPGFQLWWHEAGPELRIAIPKSEIPVTEGQSLPSLEQVNEWVKTNPFKVLYPLKTPNKFILPYGQLSFETKEGYTAIFANDNVNPVIETEVPMNTANSVATLNNTTEKMSRDIYNLTNDTNNKFKEIQEKELSSIDAIITSDIRIGKLEESMDGSTFSRYEFMRILISNKYNDSKRKERLDFYLSKNILNQNQYNELINL